MAVLFIVNPVAGRDQASTGLDALTPRLRDRFGDVRTVVTSEPGDAARAAGEGASAGASLVLVGGGDGTLNEALNGAHAAGRLGDVSFGIVPFGTGNDFAYALGVPEDPVEAIDALAEAPDIPVDVGRLNDRVFVNISAGGFIGEVSDAVSPAMKSIFGRFAYLVGGARAALTYEPVQAWVDPVGEAYALRPGADAGSATRAQSREMTVQLFAVCNSRLIGGGHLIAPDALIDDGWFDVCIVEALPLVDFMAILAKAASESAIDHPRVTYLRVRELRLAFARPVLVNTDGEPLETVRCYYKLLPGAARFRAPAPRFTSGAIPTGH